MTAGATYNSHIDYDTLKGGKVSRRVFVRKNPLLLSFPFCSRFAFAEYQKKPKSLQKELETKFKKTHIQIRGEWGDLNKYFPLHFNFSCNSVAISGFIHQDIKQRSALKWITSV
jgi:hypothetical protein